MSNSNNPKYNPIYFFIDKAKEGGYMTLNQSIKQHGKASHIYTKLERPDFIGLELEAAEKIKHKIVGFYQTRDRSLNDSNEEPIRFTCICGYRILEHKKELHICKVVYREQIMAELEEDADKLFGEF
jgi:hypothetical protein